jgi:hypothetical protein
MTLYRPHRGMLADSMKEVVEFHGMQQLVKLMCIEADWYPKDRLPSLESTVVEKYGPPGEIDGRIGWDTHIVLVNGQAWGFTDGPVT